MDYNNETDDPSRRILAAFQNDYNALLFPTESLSLSLADQSVGIALPGEMGGGEDVKHLDVRQTFNLSQHTCPGKVERNEQHDFSVVNLDCVKVKQKVIEAVKPEPPEYECDFITVQPDIGSIGFKSESLAFSTTVKEEEQNYESESLDFSARVKEEEVTSAESESLAFSTRFKEEEEKYESESLAFSTRVKEEEEKYESESFAFSTRVEEEEQTSTESARIVPAAPDWSRWSDDGSNIPRDGVLIWSGTAQSREVMTGGETRPRTRHQHSVTAHSNLRVRKGKREVVGGSEQKGETACDNANGVIAGGIEVGRGCKCTTCGETFSYPSCLKRHTRVHTGEKSYKCTGVNCDKAFSQLRSLKAHVQIHTDEKRYKCTNVNCDETFSRLIDLKRHKRIHSARKRHQCTTCGKPISVPSLTLPVILLVHSMI